MTTSQNDVAAEVLLLIAVSADPLDLTSSDPSGADDFLDRLEFVRETHGLFFDTLHFLLLASFVDVFVVLIAAGAGFGTSSTISVTVTVTTGLFL